MEFTDSKRIGKVIRKCPQTVCKIHKNKTNSDTKCLSGKRSCLKPTVSQEQSDSSNGNDFKQKKSVLNNIPVDKDKNAKNLRITRGKSCELIDHKELYKAGNTVIEVSVKGPRDKQICKTKSEKLRPKSVESNDSVDDSVDTVPVKLQPCAKKCSCHGKDEVTVTTEVKSGSKHKKCEQKPTWDYLLRDKNLLKHYVGNSKNFLQSVQPVLSDSGSLDGNPVHTLDYLIKELRRKLRTHCEDNTLQQIIADMECALLKIPSESRQGTQPFSQETQAAPSHAVKDKDIYADEIDSENVKKLQLKLEESCSFLQKMCEQMQETCCRQQVEKDELSMHLAESRRLLVVAKKREKDYEATICETKLALEAANAKSDQQLRSIHELTQLLNRLQEENKIVGPLREAQAKLSNRLKDVTLQLENVSSRLQLVTLEKDKLSVLLHEKDAKLMEMRKSIEDIQNLVGTNLINMPVIQDSDSESITTTLSTSLPTSHSNKAKTPEIVCSSPASSIAKASPTPSASWRKISSIYKKPTINHKAGIKEIFSEMKKQTRLKPNEFVLPRASDTSDTSGFSDSSDTDVPPRHTSSKKNKATGKYTFMSDSLRSDYSS